MGRTRTPTLKVYQGQNDQWYWQLQHGNGLVLDSSSEGFASRANAKRNFVKTRDSMGAITDDALKAAGRESSRGDIAVAGTSFPFA